MGRYATIGAWIRQNARGRVLNLGCKTTPWGDVRVDIVARVRPTVVADGRSLPFRCSAFDTVVFTNVIESLTDSAASNVLDETARVLSDGGRLLLTTTNERGLLLPFDPEKWILGYRFRRREETIGLVRDAGYIPESTWTVGDPLKETAIRLWMYFLFPLKLVLGRYPFIPTDADPDSYRNDESGFTYFIVARRPPGGVAKPSESP